MKPLQLDGDPRRLGFAHGLALRARIRGFLDADLARLNRILLEPTSLAALRPTIAAHHQVIVEEMPDIAEELAGLAEGAGLSLEEAVLLQIRREVMGYSRAWTGGDCTTFCRFTPDGPILGQTIDLNGDLDDQVQVLDIAHAGGRQVLVLTFTGLLGYLGSNCDGLAIGLNLVLGGAWSPGVPPYLAIRHLLDACPDVETCIEHLGKMRLASSRSLILCDSGGAAFVELCGGRMEVQRGTTLAHANHFLSEPFVACDEMNPFSKNSSVRRLDRCREGLARLNSSRDPDAYMAMLCEPPILVRSNGNIRRERTVAAVVLTPGQGAMRVRIGDVASAPTHCFILGDRDG